MHAPASEPDYLELAAAFVRGRLGRVPAGDARAVVEAGRAAGLRVHRFKRNAELPRVRRVLGLLRGLSPDSLLDVGSGRGTFLWPLLDEFAQLPVCALDRDALRARDLGAVRRGGIERLSAARMDVCALGLADNSFAASTALEVLEHLPEPERAARELVRVTRDWIVLSVPSREDDNPDHIQLYDPARLERLFLEAGAARVRTEAVRAHYVSLVRVR